MAIPQIHFDLKSWREKQKLKTQKLAQLFGISPPQVWRLEKRGTLPMVYIWAIRGYEAYQASKGVPAGREAEGVRAEP